jgi:transposase
MTITKIITPEFRAEAVRLVEQEKRKPAQVAKDIYRFILASTANYPITLLCEVLDVSRSIWYAWRKRQGQPAKDGRVRAEIRALHAEHKGRYGRPRLTAQLRQRGWRINPTRVYRILREEGLKPVQKRPYKATTDRAPDQPVAPNTLDRAFFPEAPNQVWVADITCIATAQSVYGRCDGSLFSKSDWGSGGGSHAN